MKGGGKARVGTLLLAVASALLAGCAPAVATGGAPGQLGSPGGTVALRRAARPYGATLRILVRAGGREASLRAGCAVDPARGVRVEVRDPLGATRLLVLIGEADGALLVDPARGLESRWEATSGTLPWVPDALRSFLIGPLPSGAGTPREKDGTVHFGWTSGSGTVKGTLVPSPAGPAPFTEGEFRGPGRSRLHLVISGAEPGELRPEALSRPTMDLRITDIWDLLSGGAP